MQKRKIIKNIISGVFMIAMLTIAIKFYSYNNFNEFIRAEYKSGITNFSRDENVKYSKMSSYKIENKDYNDAMFFKKIVVAPNTAYRVTCMVKTENVENKNQNKDAGAHICINNSTEKSENVKGTTDWKEIQFIFNSKNRTELEVGFRLGGNIDNSKGIAWFSDIKIESATADISSEWNFLCLVFDKTNVTLNINGERKTFNLSLSTTDVYDMKNSMTRFADSMYDLSKHKISINYDVIEIATPITQMSYDEENGFYVAAYDVGEVLDKYIAEGKYDHIFVAFRTGDINKKSEIPVNDWIGLGGMEYRNIGFSNIRLPSNDSNYIYKYDSRINMFPEEVFVHEFLHTLERNAEEYGYERPELHAYEKYGYTAQNLYGLRQWYADYMNKQINSSDGKIGLPEEIFDKKPAKIGQFTYSTELDLFHEPSNIIEELHGIYVKIVNLFKIVKVKYIDTNETQNIN